jgi:hypothetical protein
VWVLTAGDYNKKGRSILRPYKIPAGWTPGGYLPHQMTNKSADYLATATCNLLLSFPLRNSTTYTPGENFRLLIEAKPDTTLPSAEKTLTDAFTGRFTNLMPLTVLTALTASSILFFFKIENSFWVTVVMVATPVTPQRTR